MTRQKKLFIIFGTRPEAIKMAPLIKSLETHPYLKPVVCITGQHRQILDQVLQFFNIPVDYDLNIIKQGQTLFDITINILSDLKNILIKEKPDLVLVHGDTTTTFAASIAGFYSNIKIAHIEAGLRSGDILAPYPEEANRKMVGHLAHYHFTPTQLASDNLALENITKNVHMVGNTVIDALLLGLNMIKQSSKNLYSEYFNFLDLDKKIILVTSHRRENFGKPLENIFSALKFLAEENPDIQFVYPVHPNPNVSIPANNLLSNHANIFLITSLEYPYTIWLMQKAHIIITDSGGIQEEGPSLKKPILVTRDVTERMEGIQAGVAKLVGTNTEKIIHEVNKLLYDNDYYNKMATGINPYGDGKAVEYIINVLEKELLYEN